VKIRLFPILRYWPSHPPPGTEENHDIVGFEVLTAVVTKGSIFVGTMP
jgi:hypothetical protein